MTTLACSLRAIVSTRPSTFKMYKIGADHASLKLHLKPQHGWDATSLTDIADAFAFFTDPRNDIKGVVVMADFLFNDLRADVVKIANGAKLTPAIPTIYQWRQFVDTGRPRQFRTRNRGGL